MKTIRKGLTLWAVAVLIPTLLALLAAWHWRPGAFVLAAVLLMGGALLLHDIVSRGEMANGAYRLAVVVSLATILLLAWMNAAVGGILGDNPANMMYFGVLLVGSIGAVIARAAPLGMSGALLAMAFGMVMIPVVAWFNGTPAFANGMVAVFSLHTFFALLFTSSALLFRHAARTASGSDGKFVR